MKVVTGRSFIAPKPVTSILARFDVSQYDPIPVHANSFAEDKVTALYPLFGWSSSRLSDMQV